MVRLARWTRAIAIISVLAGCRMVPGDWQAPPVAESPQARLLREEIGRQLMAVVDTVRFLKVVTSVGVEEKTQPFPVGTLIPTSSADGDVRVQEPQVMDGFHLFMPSAVDQLTLTGENADIGFTYDLANAAAIPLPSRELSLRVSLVGRAQLRSSQARIEEAQLIAVVRGPSQLTKYHLMAARVSEGLAGEVPSTLSLNFEEYDRLKETIDGRINGQTRGAGIIVITMEGDSMTARAERLVVPVAGTQLEINGLYLSRTREAHQQPVTLGQMTARLTSGLEIGIDLKSTGDAPLHLKVTPIPSTAPRADRPVVTNGDQP